MARRNEPPASCASHIRPHPSRAPRSMFGGGYGLNEVEQLEILDCFQRMRHLFPDPAGEPLFLMRLAHADPPSARSLRRPLEALFAQRGSQAFDHDADTLHLMAFKAPDRPDLCAEFLHQHELVLAELGIHPWS